MDWKSFWDAFWPAFVRAALAFAAMEVVMYFLGFGIFAAVQDGRREKRTPERDDTERLVERIMRLPVEQRQELAHLVTQKILANWDREQARSGELP
jgi:hypothetical protein